MRWELRAEWTKLRTVAGTGWMLLAIPILTVALSAVASAVVTCPAGRCPYDVAKVSLLGVQLGQVFVAILAVLVISNEYSTGMVRTTFAAMPRRVTVLAAKATVLVGLTLAAGTAAVLGSVLAGRLLLSGSGYPLLSLADGPTLRATAGTVLYFALVALLSLGIGAAARDPAAATGSVLALLYLPQVLILLVPDPDWQRLLWQLSPVSAGLAIQATTSAAGLPLGPWEGLGVLAGWAAAAMTVGGLLLRLRDA